MNNKKIVINPTTSDRPLDLYVLFNAKLVALLTEDDPMLSPMLKHFKIRWRRLMQILRTSNISPETYTNPTNYSIWTVN